MAEPKKKKSRTRSRQGRANKKIQNKSLSLCPKCKTAKMPHRICENCGYYKEKIVIKK